MRLKDLSLDDLKLFLTVATKVISLDQSGESLKVVSNALSQFYSGLDLREKDQYLMSVLGFVSDSNYEFKYLVDLHTHMVESKPMVFNDLYSTVNDLYLEELNKRFF